MYMHGVFYKYIYRPFRYLLHITRLSVFPTECKACSNILEDENESIICSSCKEKLVRYTGPVCSLCGRVSYNGDPFCGECIVNPPPYKKNLSYAPYRGLLKKLILIYKYTGVEKLKYHFAPMLIELVKEIQIHGEPFDYIIPVPPDAGRKREFAPILEIVKIVSREVNIPLLTGHLIKVKKTPPQATLGRAKRLRNLDGAFQLKKPEDIKKKRILLVDDVYTTGTTVHKCCQLLIPYVQDVSVITLAHS